MPVGSAVYQLIQAAVNRGLRDADFLALYDQQAATAGLDLDGRGPGSGGGGQGPASGSSTKS